MTQETWKTSGPTADRFQVAGTSLPILNVASGISEPSSMNAVPNQTVTGTQRIWDAMTRFDTRTHMDPAIDCIMFDPYSPTESNDSLCHSLPGDDSTIENPPRVLLLSTPAVEQSFIFGPSSGGQVVPMIELSSPDYDNEGAGGCSMLDEVNQVSENGFYYKAGTAPAAAAEALRCLNAAPLGFFHSVTAGTCFGSAGISGQFHRGASVHRETNEQMGDVMFSAFTFGTSDHKASMWIQHQPTFDEEDISPWSHCVDDSTQMTPPASPDKMDSCREDKENEMLKGCQDFEENEKEVKNQTEQASGDVTDKDDDIDDDDDDEEEDGDEQEVSEGLEIKEDETDYLSSGACFHQCSSNEVIRKRFQMQNEHNYHIPMLHFGCDHRKEEESPVKKAQKIAEHDEPSEQHSAGSFPSEEESLSQKTEGYAGQPEPLPLRIKPLVVLHMPRVSEPEPVVNTPDLTNSLLDLESDLLDFDLVTFINSPEPLPIENKDREEVTNKVDSSVSHPPANVAVSLQESLSDCPTEGSIPTSGPSEVFQSCPSPRLRRRRHHPTDSDDDYTPNLTSDAVCGASSSRQCSSPPASPSPPKRGRGRPPKTCATVHSLAQFRHVLNETDIRYLEMRNKNNEASRRSRIQRKGRDRQIEDEADELQTRYEQLVSIDQRMEQLCKNWRERLLRLAME